MATLLFLGLVRVIPESCLHRHRVIPSNSGGKRHAKTNPGGNPELLGVNLKSSLGNASDVLSTNTANFFTARQGQHQ